MSRILSKTVDNYEKSCYTVKYNSNNSDSIISFIFVVVNRKEVIFLTKTEIKQLAKNAGVYMWQIAEKLGITDSTFSRKLRRPLSETDTKKVLAALQQLTAEQATQTQ